MPKLALLLLIPLLFFLTSCTIDWNSEKDKEIAELEKQVQELKEKNDDELFKKKQECLNQFDNIDKRLKEYASDYTFELEEIFYSSILNQCVYIDIFGPNYKIKRLMSIGSNVGGNPINELSCDLESVNGCIAFDEKILKLKGE